MAPKGSGIAGLVRALRVAEPGSNNLGRHVAEHADVLAPLLGVAAERFRGVEGLADEALASELDDLLQRRADEQERRHRAAVAARSSIAAGHLARSAIWQGDAVTLDVCVLLGELLVDGGQKFVAFTAPSFEVAFTRTMLVETGRALRNWLDLRSWVDADGLHLRWRGGRGGLNYIPQLVPSSDRERVLRVVLPARAVEPVLVPIQPARRVRGAWLRDVLRDIGLVP